MPRDLKDRVGAERGRRDSECIAGFFFHNPQNRACPRAADYVRSLACLRGFRRNLHDGDASARSAAHAVRVSQWTGRGDPLLLFRRCDPEHPAGRRVLPGSGAPRTRHAREQRCHLSISQRAREPSTRRSDAVAIRMGGQCRRGVTATSAHCVLGATMVLERSLTVSRQPCASCRDQLKCKAK